MLRGACPASCVCTAFGPYACQLAWRVPRLCVIEHLCHEMQPEEHSTIQIILAPLFQGRDGRRTSMSGLHNAKHSLCSRTLLEQDLGQKALEGS